MIKRRLPSHPASRRIHATKAECARRIQPVQASRRHPTGRPELRSPPPDVPAEVSRAAAERECSMRRAPMPTNMGSASSGDQVNCGHEEHLLGELPKSPCELSAHISPVMNVWGGGAFFLSPLVRPARLAGEAAPLPGG
jgi:hypothetical protein